MEIRKECPGNGECLIQCSCNCKDCGICKLSIDDCKCAESPNCPICFQPNNLCEGYNCPYPVIFWKECKCGHRDRHGYCKPTPPCSKGCEPTLCSNDRNHDEEIKGTLYPQWLFDCHGGNCNHCAESYGHGFKHTKEMGECPVCFELREMTKLRCNHLICWDCWKKICDGRSNDRNTRASCPLCRKSKW